MISEKRHTDYQEENVICVITCFHDNAAPALGTYACPGGEAIIALDAVLIEGMTREAKRRDQ